MSWRTELFKDTKMQKFVQSDLLFFIENIQNIMRDKMDSRQTDT